MSGPVISTQADLGRRIAEAREGTSKTQADLAALVGLDRTAIVKIEAGIRKVSATELVAIAHATGMPIDWFVVESPPAVVSRRRDPAVGGFSRTFDLELEHIARDVAFLTDRDVLTHAAGRTPNKLPGSFKDAEDLARNARTEAGQPNGPVLDLQAACERLGLLGFSMALGSDAGDAAYVQVGALGVALINGSTEPGRRRFSLAHELGHYLVGDAYEPEPRFSAAETERMLNAFAAYVLMPRSAVVSTWNEFASRSSRLAATAVAVRFRVSWTVACNQLTNLGLIDSRERELLVERDLKKGEVFELGERWSPELDPPAIPPGYASAVVKAYRARRLTSARAIELLHGTVTESELPEPEEMSLDQLRHEFDPRS